MWDRKELKARGKAAFKANYWRCVAVALILLVFFASTGASVSNSAGNGVDNYSQQSQAVDAAAGRIKAILSGLSHAELAQIALAVTGAVIGVSIAAFFLDALVFNPLGLGCRRFFLVNTAEPAGFGELGFGFKNNYGNVVVTLLLKDVFTVLWALLFVIPGIVKSYSYRMVPYILSEHPDMDPTAVITLSRRMMDGNKWAAFVLDLSFLGWDILSAVTFQLVGVFYSNPYKHATDAELYQAIKGNAA